tara:strand:- start:1436 stop:1960 length:525 start_codon:yes stop_codon:yes gene_type:complete
MERSGLRCFEDSEVDFALLQEIFFDPLFLKFMQPRESETLTDRRINFSQITISNRLMNLVRISNVRDDGLRVLFIKENREPIGFSGILCKSSGLDIPELSIYIRKKFRGHGFAKEGIALATQQFSSSNYAAFVDFDNDKSQKLISSVGLKLSGSGFHRNLKRDGLIYLTSNTKE